METCVNYCDPAWAFVSSDERRIINKIHKLANEHPDEMVILEEPENNGGFIYAKFPPRWMKIAPPRQIVMSDEERARRAEILRCSRRTSSGDDGSDVIE